jgi:hypothetical protein
MLIRILAIAVVWLCCCIGYAEEAVEIPLSEAWGLNFRETKQAAHLERESNAKDEYRPPTYEERSQRLINSMTYQIHRALGDRSRTEMRPGFAVTGEGREALEQVHAILVKGKTSQDRFPQGIKISAVFFTRRIGSMHLMKIERVGNTITINYCREPTASHPIVSPKVAMIPLGKLAPGKYRVNILGFSKKPDSPKSSCEPITEDRIKNQVCQPYEFEIVESASE